MALRPYLVIPDTHVPYHDKRAWILMLKVAAQLKLYGIVILGDFADCYAVSSHSKDPKRSLQFDYEISEVRKRLDDLGKLGAKHKVFVAGNHEDRLLRYLRDKAPELHSVISIPKLFKLNQKKWEYVAYKEDYQLGKLSITHDVGSAGRYSTYKCLDTYQHSNLTGHTHRMSYVVEGNARGEHKLSAQFGWLGDVNEVDYMHKTSAKKNWVPGFGVLYLNTETEYCYVTPVPIVDYTACVNGKLYKG